MLPTTSKTFIWISSLKRDKRIPYTYNDPSKPDQQPIDGELVFDICGGVDVIPTSCEGEGGAAVLFISKDQKFCRRLMSSKEENNTYEVMDKEKPLDGFTIQRMHSDFKVNIKCDENANQPHFELNDFGFNIMSKSNCGKYNEAGRFFDNNKSITCLFLIGIGCVLLFLGGYQWDLLMTFIGFTIGFCIAFMIFWTVIDFKESSAIYFLLFIIACALGGGMAWAFNKYSFIGEMIIGFFLGYALAGYFMFFFEKWMNDVG